ncbi:MAG: hypothetical protein AB8B61_07515 [Cyclobacteriaceae bacterium]
MRTEIVDIALTKGYLGDYKLITEKSAEVIVVNSKRATGKVSIHFKE